MATKTLDQLTVADLSSAKSTRAEAPVLTKGKYVMQLVSERTEENYAYFTFKYNEFKYTFFYNILIKGTEEVNKEVMEWIIALNGMKADGRKTLREIINDSIGKFYEIAVDNYTPTKGKNMGKPTNSINFSVKPEVKVVTIQTEEVDLFATSPLPEVKQPDESMRGVTIVDSKTQEEPDLSFLDDDSPFADETY